MASPLGVLANAEPWALTPEEFALLDPDQQIEYLANADSLHGIESLPDFIKRVAPHQPPPPHLAPVIEILERAKRRDEVRACISMPPRHAKTITLLRGIAWWVAHSPADTCGYYTYNNERALSKSRVCRGIIETAGVHLANEGLGEWRTRQGGGLLVGGVGGGLTGEGIHGVLLIDDPFKNREEADSSLNRQKVWEWFNEVGFTRLESASIIVMHTRWHKDDLIGRLTAMGGWESINLPASAEAGDPKRKPDTALWPSRYPAAKLARIRAQIGEFSYAALYQGRPRPRGARLFGDPTFYDPDKTDLSGCRIVLALDPAASESTSADFSAMGAIAVKGHDPATRVAFVLKAYRKQVTIPQLVKDALEFQRQFQAPLIIEAVGGFKAVPQALRAIDPKIRIKEITPVGDKFQRAQGVASAWNSGRVMVPLGNPPWLKPLLDELDEFTGVNDRHDDQVDWLSHAWNNIAGRSMFEVV